MHLSPRLIRQSGVTQTLEQRLYVRKIQALCRLVLTQQQVHQIIVRQLQQARERIDFIIRQSGFMGIQKAREDQIVLEQTTPAAPSQACTA